VQFRLAALVFDGKGLLAATGPGLELDEIGNAGQVQPCRSEWHRMHPPHTAPLAAANLVGHRMQDLALGSEPVFVPKPFKVDERRLAQAIHCMLHRRDEDGIPLGGERGNQTSSRISTPRGRPSRSISIV
jgi:hypothetical protein